MTVNSDCPCWGCTDRPNCKGCERGNAWRKKKQEEREQRYKEKAFHRYEMDKFKDKAQKHAERSQKPKRLLNRKR